MKQSELFIRTLREAPNDEEAKNAQLLIRAGFINKEMAGVYSYLPLGLRVLRNIENIVREEMDAIGGNELQFSIIHPKENWEKTGRWNTVDVLFKVQSQTGKMYALGPTHEEMIFPLAKKQISSYRDLPAAYYQIQTKLRDEVRAKSGILRGREFLMKDLYSFHKDEADLEKYYSKVQEAYSKIFKRLGLKVLLVDASGGTFSKFSHEYQVLVPVGEDIIVYCSDCDFASNAEITEVKNGDSCPKCKKGRISSSNGAEVGNIFKLNPKFSEAFEVKFKDEEGKEKLVVAGCYGMGVSRIMGVIAEVNNDEKGLKWPEAVAPFKLHLIELTKDLGKNLYEKLSNLQGNKNNILYDDRDAKAGEKFNDADLIGIPWRAVVSEKTAGKIELKKRGETESKLVTEEELIKILG